MLISYIQQYVIILAAYLFIVCNTIWTPAIVSGFCHLTHRHDQSTAKADAQRITKRITSVKQIDTLVTALLDFQKSQLFFSVALQAACLYAVHNPAILAARSSRELQSGLLLLTIVGVSGVYPVVLNLLTLRLGGKKTLDLFTFVLAVCTVILASANLLLSAPAVMKPSQLMQDGFNPVSCGGVNPQQYCMSADQTVVKLWTEGFHYSGAATWQAAGLVVPWLAIIHAGAERFITAAIKRLSGKAATAANLVVKFGLFVLHVWLFLGVVVLLYVVGGILSYKEATARDRWSLGQTIAVTVWVPCVVQWLYMVCCKYTLPSP